MEQEPQGSRAVSKPCWDAQLSSSAQGCQHGYGSQSRAPALPQEPCLHPLSAMGRRAMGKERSPRDREVAQLQSRAADGFTFWQDSRNSSIVTTPSLFRSIFCIQAQYDGMAGTAAASGRAQHPVPGSCRGWTQHTPAPAIPKHLAGPGWPFLFLAPAQPCFIPSMGCFLLHHARFWAATGSVLELFFSRTCSAHLEKVLHMLPGCFLPHGRVGVFAHHVIDGLHDVQHFLEAR